MSEGLSVTDELRVLQMEYERMSAELRMYVEQYSPKFNIFGVLVLSAITFAWKDPKYELAYPIIPYFIFVIGGVAIAQSYVITCLAERVRQIELRVAELNNGRPVMTWEHVMAMKLMYRPWLSIPFKDTRRGLFRGPNPVFGSVVLTIISIVPLVVFCLVKSWSVIPMPWGVVYMVFTALLFAGMMWYATSFFRLGPITDALSYYEDGDRGDADPGQSI